MNGPSSVANDSGIAERSTKRRAAGQVGGLELMFAFSIDGDGRLPLNHPVRHEREAVEQGDLRDEHGLPRCGTTHQIRVDEPGVCPTK